MVAMTRWLPLTLLLEVTAKPKVPHVQWGQKPDRLYLTIPLKEVTEPEVELEEKRIFFKGISHGQDYEVNLHLLRGINVTTSKYDLSEKAVSFELPKLVSEPCWKRLIRSKKPAPHIKKDTARLYPDQCYDMMVQWREAYFYAKLHPKEAEEAKASQENPKVDPKAEERKDFERKLEALRANAVPRKQKQKKPKKGKSEL
ncbi:unnamed protein product [Effrenium voratum]|nr:unnamed protein product [Effrenium voratum]